MLLKYSFLKNEETRTNKDINLCYVLDNTSKKYKLCICFAFFCIILWILHHHEKGNAIYNVLHKKCSVMQQDVNEYIALQSASHEGVGVCIGFFMELWHTIF